MEHLLCFRKYLSARLAADAAVDCMSHSSNNRGSHNPKLFRRAKARRPVRAVTVKEKMNTQKNRPAHPSCHVRHYSVMMPKETPSLCAAVPRSSPISGGGKCKPKENKSNSHPVVARSCGALLFRQLFPKPPTHTHDGCTRKLLLA